MNTNNLKERSLLVLEEIKKARSVLLHCHPSPDPDSVGSALAMKFAVEQLGVKATVIKGDSDIPQAFMHFPGAKDIVMKSYWEIDPNDYDLFIIVDSDLTGVSRAKQIKELPSSMTMINIDHHRTNNGFGKINITEPSYPATGQLLYDIFVEMGITITPEISANLFMGIFSDTGGFKYEGVNSATFDIAGKLINIYPDFSKLIEKMENSNSLEDLSFQGLALDSIEELSGKRILASVISYSKIQERKISDENISTGLISRTLRTASGYDLFVVIVEPKPNEIKVSFRTIDSNKYDVSKLAASIGGGGHKAAAGALLNMPIEQAKSLVVSKVKELYNF